MSRPASHNHHDLHPVQRSSLLLMLPALFLSALPGTAVQAKPDFLSTALPEFECLITPEMVVEVFSPTEGIIEKVLVDKSDTIKKDQILAHLEATLQEATVAEAQARSDMDDEVNLKKTNLNFAKRNLVRMTELHNKKNISPFEIDEAKTAVKLAELEFKKAKSAKHLAKLELNHARRILNLRTLRSPINGIVVERYISPGESATDRPVFRLAQINPLRVALIVPVDYFGQINPDMQAKITPEISSLGSFNATVTVVDKIVDAASGTFSVRLALPNEDLKLPGGLKCKAEFF